MSNNKTILEKHKDTNHLTDLIYRICGNTFVNIRQLREHTKVSKVTKKNRLVASHGRVRLSAAKVT